MRKSRSFKANGINALEGRVVMSHVPAAAAAGGVIHRTRGRARRRRLRQLPEFLEQHHHADRQGLAGREREPRTSYQQAEQDYETIDLTIANLVNGLGNQLAGQLHRRCSRESGI